MIRFDFFDRPENKNFDPENVRIVSMDLPADTTLWDALRAARAARLLGEGTHRSGCFEVQSDLGVWQQVNGKKMVESRPHLVEFKTWEELEAEELAELAA